MEKIKEIKKAYEDILQICEKHSDLKEKYGWNFDDINQMITNSKNHLTLIEWFEKYGLKLKHEYEPYSFIHFRVNGHISFSYYKDAQKDKENGRGKYISCSDNGKQPSEEWLLVIGFSTGPLIFGDDYDSQKPLFGDFFNELKSYNPDYSDSVNDSLYWKLENSKEIFEDFNNILNKYRERNRKELKQRKIEKMEKELSKLKGKSL